MSFLQRIKWHRKLLTNFSPKKEFKFEFNWLKVSSVWLFIVFGFYGWGATSLSALTSTPSVLTSIALVSVFAIYYSYSDRYAFKLTEALTIQVRQIYVVFGILLFLCAINLGWVFRSLTGDELAYALQSQGQSYVIVKKFLAMFPQFGTVPFRLLLQMCSAFLLLGFFLTIRLMLKIKSPKYFVLTCFTITLLFRIVSTGVGGSIGANPPGSFFFYLIGSTVLTPSNLSYRILSLLFASIFLAIIYEFLRKIPNLSRLMRVLILLFVLSIPLFRHMSLLVEISIWYFYFATILLLFLLLSTNLAKHQLIFMGALATSLRFPIIALLIPLFLIQFLDVKHIGIRFKRPTSLVMSILGLLPCFPGFIWISTTRFLDKYNNVTSSNGMFGSQFAEFKRSSSEILSTLSVTTSKLSWMICFIGLFLFLKQSRNNYIFVGLLLVAEFLFFFVLNSGELAYAAKYIIEWFIPFIVLALVTISSKVKLRTPIKQMFPLFLILIIATNASDYNRIPENFVSLSTSQSSGYLVETNTNRLVASVPFPYDAAFNLLKEKQEFPECLNVGVVYGVYSQILEGYSAENVLAALAVDHKFLIAQNVIHENWMTASVSSIENSGANCVIVGNVVHQQKTINDLLANNWRIKDRFLDKDYHTKVFILSR